MCSTSDMLPSSLGPTSQHPSARSSATAARTTAAPTRAVMCLILQCSVDVSQPSVGRNDWMNVSGNSVQVVGETHLETSGKRIPFRISLSVMYDARLHCKNKQMILVIIYWKTKEWFISDQAFVEPVYLISMPMGLQQSKMQGHLIRWAIHIVLLIKTYHSAAAWSMPSEICRAPERRAPKPILNMTNFHQ